MKYNVFFGLIIFLLLLLNNIGKSQDNTNNPTSKLPSNPGPHIEKIKALGDNKWLELSAPRPDPTYGPSHGRSWSSRMAYAKDLGGAFIFGEGTHGVMYKDNFYADDLFFYDSNSNSWVCLYPGFDVTKYKDVKINDDGFETINGAPTPIASMVHGYAMTIYNSDTQSFMFMPCPGNYWDKIIGRRDVLGAGGEEFSPKINNLHASPWIWDVKKGSWNRFKTKNKISKPLGFGAALVYIPSIKKIWVYSRSGTYYYNIATNDWETITPLGPKPPFGLEMNVCFDTKRQRVYLAGGDYPKAAKGTNAFWIYDIQSNTFVNPEPKGEPCNGETGYGTNDAIMNYDNANDVVVLFKTSKQGSGVYIYNPESNEWSTALTASETLYFTKDNTRGSYSPFAIRSGFYDEHLNVHFVLGSTDTFFPENKPYWEALVYRYKTTK